MADSIVFFIFLFVVIGLFFHFCVPKRTASEKNKWTPFDREVGETLIYDVLEPLEKYGFKFLFNVYVPRGNERDKTTEIDVLMIGQCGVFVFESKNYSGWIFGNEKNRYWTQVLYSERHRFYNPIRQNKNHIRWIRKYVGYTTPIHSIVVFSNRCTFKDITYESEVKIVHREDLRETVSEILHDESIPQISEEQIQAIFDTLSPFTNASYEIRRKHIENIENAC